MTLHARRASNTVDHAALAPVLEGTEAGFFEELYRAAPPALAQATGLEFERSGAEALLLARNLDVLMCNRAMGLGVDGPTTPERLDAVLERLRAAGVPRFFFSLCPHAQPPELPQWLVERGLTPYNNWVKLWRDVSPPPPVNTLLHLEQVERRHAAVMASILCEAFRYPEVMGEWFSATVGRPDWRHYVAFDRTTPVATAALFVQGETAYIGMAATRESHRGRGAQHALVALRIRDAAAAGCRRIVVETAEDKTEKPAPSFRNLRSLGFQVAYVRPNYLWKRE